MIGWAKSGNDAIPVYRGANAQKLRDAPGLPHLHPATFGGNRPNVDYGK